ncbi:MAG: hypothetical protein ACKOA8_01365, partial [Deltaproteobacteria bacterium]
FMAFPAQGVFAGEIHILQCQSIDKTFRPYFSVHVGYPITGQGVYHVTLTQADDLGSLKGKTIEAYGTGKVSKTGFFFDFKEVSARRKNLVTGTLKGKQLSNGSLSATLEIKDLDRQHELVCQRLR